MKKFREGLVKFCRETLDITKHYETATIFLLLEDFLGADKINFIKKQIGGAMCYGVKSSKTFELLKTYNYY